METPLKGKVSWKGSRTSLASNGSGPVNWQACLPRALQQDTGEARAMRHGSVENRSEGEVQRCNVSKTWIRRRCAR